MIVFLNWCVSGLGIRFPMELLSFKDWDSPEFFSKISGNERAQGAEQVGLTPRAA